MTKKKVLISKLNHTQSAVEGIFKYYYDILDELRCKYLEGEYAMRNQMETFERDLKKLTKSLRQYSLIEFFYDE